jgi:hypothetical protein
MSFLAESERPNGASLARVVLSGMEAAGAQ